ncbi:hypothetical protein PVK06_041314 [Gossypium arboreum]|uniref:Uncharacterized protein n=1 Tax=Gossypium arboreum TaxID=29729 RepID=A0ABR0NAN8_GOSAR|nr:hypothetical protein PVK06_041314 [Gossypium arboreum]
MDAHETHSKRTVRGARGISSHELREAHGLSSHIPKEFACREPELKGIVERWKEATKRNICAGDSSGSSQKFALLIFSFFLQAFLAVAFAKC